jgi:hyperosmotically inducible protein
MFNKFSYALCGAGLALMMAGPAWAQTTTTTDAGDKAAKAARQTGNAVSDAALTSAVKTKLAADKMVAGLDIDVDSSHGVVTLSGPVRTAAERAQAVRVARNTKGVSRVVDNLKIDATAATSGRTDADTSKDTTIVIKDDVTPKVKKGAAKTADVAKDVAGKTADVAKTVAGKTTDAAKKTADTVKDTKVEVKDDVGAGDAAVTTAVKTRLMGDDVARATAIDVHTNDGVVTIAGKVPSAADKTRIGQLVEKTTGVKRVVNNLTVR